MRDAIAWSHDLLSAGRAGPLPPPRGLRRRLHAGGGRGGGESRSRGVEESSRRTDSSSTPRLPDSSTPLDLVASLVDKSLLRVEATVGGADAVRDAGDDPRVRAGAAGGERGGGRRRDPPTPSGASPSPRRPCRERGTGCRRLARLAGTGASQPAGGPGLAGRAGRRTARCIDWRPRSDRLWLDALPLRAKGGGGWSSR